MTLLLLAALALPDAPVSHLDTRAYLCLRAPGPITVDGRLDDPGWRGIPWTEDFLDIQGKSLPAPRHRARAKMTWDENSFYIAAELDEPHLWATLKDHDAVIFHDNDFEVFLDPDGDHHNYDEFEINALGTTWDLRLDKPYRDGGPARNEREIAGLKSAVHLDGTLNDPSDLDRGWTVEIAIPFASLAPGNDTPLPPRDGDTWRVNFSRVQWRLNIVGDRYEKVPNSPEDNWVWSPQGAIDMHRPERWGRVQFSAQAPGGDARLLPDIEGPARDLLVDIYHAQRAFQKAEGRWADRLEDLDLGGRVAASGLSAMVEAVAGGYRATVALPDAGKILAIGPDSRLVREPAPAQADAPEGAPHPMVGEDGPINR